MIMGAVIPSSGSRAYPMLMRLTLGYLPLSLLLYLVQSAHPQVGRADSCTEPCSRYRD